MVQLLYSICHEEETMTEERPRRQYGEKEEKQEKHEEKDEKRWEEKWRRDPLSAAAWAVILIWAGVMLLAQNFNLLARIPYLDGWSIFFLGAGGILLLEIVVRLLVPAYRQPVRGTAILAIIFLAIGLGGIVDWRCLGPAIVIGIGLALLLTGLFRRRE
jgi:hypothetical protein